ncbi:amidase [Rhodococcus sp. NPDC056960]|uniref:amidase n=1 Tax=Rhodococcus sp. NPDC056960 TaxID=3345982 RepID=UPI00363AEE79
MITTANTSAEAAVRSNLDHMEKYEPEITSLITIRQEESIAEARRLDEQVENGFWPGPLYGMTLTVKDNFDVAGTPTTNGTSFAYAHSASEDCFVIDRVKEAGAVVVAKANQSEYCQSVTNQNIHHGSCRNPWGLDRIAGGSSGGSAAGVAAGMATASIGSDSGGSIRIPASLNGLVGLRPSAGRLSNRRTASTRVATFTVGGPLARTAVDAARLFHAMDAYDPADVTSVRRRRDHTLGHGRVGLEGLRIGVPKNYFMDDVDSEILAAVNTAIGTLSDLGAHIREVHVPGAEQCRTHFYPMVTANFFALYGDYLDRPVEDLDPEVVMSLEHGRSVTATQFAEAAMYRQLFVRNLEEFFDEVDVFVSPTVPIATPRLGKLEHSEMMDVSRTNFVQPFAGIPGISIPCGFRSDGMPIGLQMTAGYWMDTVLLNAAIAFQNATRFHTHRPPLVR